MVDDGTLCLLMYLTMNVYETRLDRALSALSNLTFFILVSPLCDGVTRGGPPPPRTPLVTPLRLRQKNMYNNQTKQWNRGIVNIEIRLHE